MRQWQVLSMVGAAVVAGLVWVAIRSRTHWYLPRGRQAVWYAVGIGVALVLGLGLGLIVKWLRK